MPPEISAPGSPADWLRHAYSDLALARIVPVPQILLEQLCFHAQQAATPMAEDALEMRARRGDRAKFEAAMAKAPDVEPEEYDMPNRTSVMISSTARDLPEHREELMPEVEISPDDDFHVDVSSDGEP